MRIRHKHRPFRHFSAARQVRSITGSGGLPPLSHAENARCRQNRERPRAIAICDHRCAFRPRNSGFPGGCNRGRVPAGEEVCLFFLTRMAAVAARATVDATETATRSDPSERLFT
jgi:hypothetical protein